MPDTTQRTGTDGLKNFSLFLIGVALCVFVPVLLNYPPRRSSGAALPGPGERPAGQEAGGAEDTGIIPGGTPEAPDILPLERSLTEIERLYAGKMELAGTTLLTSGPLSGGTIKTYRTGTATTDELELKGDLVYKRSLAFNISEIEGNAASFCSSVPLLVLYPTAYDKQLVQYELPIAVRHNAAKFGSECAALRPDAGQQAEQYEIIGDYVFGCINSDNTRLKFVVSSEGLFRAEKFGTAADY